MKKSVYYSLSSLLLISGASALQGAAITPGDLVIYRVGDGTAALGTTATSVFLDEYTTGGSLVQTIALPTTGASALTAVGNATTEGTISLSQNGSFFTFTGYRKDVGGTSPAADTLGTTARVIGTLSTAGILDTSISLTSMGGSTAANSIRSATSVDGSAFWVSSSVNVSYLGSPGPASSSTLIDTRNSRQIRVNGNTVYAANGSTAITSKLQSYGTLPTGATVPTPIITLGTADAIQGFALFNVNNANPGGADTVYALSTVANQLLKYSFNGSSWVSDGSISAGGAQDVTGVVNGTSVSLYLTSTATLSTFTDASGFGGALSGSLTSLATAGANTGFRGLEVLTVVPEPTTFALGGFGLLALMIARRSKKQA